MADRLAVPAAVLLAVLLGGCGGAGASGGATVDAYFAAPLCKGAGLVLERAGSRAADVTVRLVCLPAAEAGGRVELATLGANARRATEDSASIAFVGTTNPAAAKFSRPILESAGVGWLGARSGARAMRTVLAAVEASGSGSLRDQVRERLEQG